MANVELRGVARRFGAVTALHSTSLRVEEGEFLTLLGPSGCGKTTTLRMIAGFVQPSEGRVLIGDDDVTDLPANRRQIGMVFQDYALFPHLTIAENIVFSLRERRVGRAAIARRLGEMLELIRLPTIGDRYPAQISGGQQQRVALARALAHPPRVLLMDEPLGALDLKLRETMQDELRRIQKALGITTIYVTHDQVEAMNLSDSIAVMAGGKVIQRGSAREIYDRPRTRFVADFVGKMNFIGGTVVDGALVLADGTTVKLPANQPAAGTVTLGVRPENLVLVEVETPLDGRNVMTGTVLRATYGGNLCHLVVALGAVEWTVEFRPGERQPAEGERVAVAWAADAAVVLGFKEDGTGGTG